MNTKTAFLVIIALAILGLGVFFYRQKNQEAAPIPVSNNAQQNDAHAMMDDSHAIGAIMVAGMLNTVWPGNELSPIDHAITFKNGTTIAPDGTITAKDGKKIILKENELLTQDGQRAIVDLNDYALMEMPEDPGPQTAPNPNARAGSYVDFSPQLLASEQQAGHKVVLFFKASWCPFCKAADKAFLAKLDQIPAGVTILKTDYDTNTDLKNKYAVTYQHTFVQIDAQGNQVSKWSGGDIENLKKYLK